MRREFSKPLRFEIIRRASNEKGQIVCEGCGLILGSKPHEIDHTIPEAMVADKTKPLTAADGRLLGLMCCHRPKTAVDVGNIAKVKRLELRRLGIKKRSSFPKPPPGYNHWTRRIEKEPT